MPNKASNALIAVDSVLNSSPKFKDLRLSMPSSIRASFIGSIKVVPGFRDKIFIALNNVADSGRIWKVSDVFGTPIFTNISRNMPKGLPVNWVECDPFNPEQVIFAGTDYGLYITEDGGQTWLKDTRLPSTVISCISIHKNKKDIYFFTHGRGVFKGQINNAGISSIADSKIDILKSAYTVPADDVLNLEFKETISGTYLISDLTGKTVLEGKIEGVKVSISTASLQAGNYILTHSGNGQTGVIRFTIQH